MEESQPANWSGNPLRLPRVRHDDLPTVTGDRRPAVKFCAGCGTALETGIVMRGYWAYCSIECAIRTEREDQRRRA
jgi:hypothetical protein